MVQSMLEISRLSSQWRALRTVEGVRLMQMRLPSTGTLCRRAQVVVKNAPVDTFLTIMETPSPFWLNRPDLESDIKVLRVIDDHTDIVQLTLIKRATADFYPSSGSEFQFEVIMHRFWKRDDDGVYLVAYSSAGQGQFTYPGSKPKPVVSLSSSSGQGMNIVLTVSPRRDHRDFEDDVNESLVCCCSQISEAGWSQRHLDSVLDSLLDFLLDLRTHFVHSAFNRVQPGLDLNPKFVSSVTYASDKAVRSGVAHGVSAPIFVKRETESPPEVLSKSSIGSKLALLRGYSSPEVLIAPPLLPEKINTSDAAPPPLPHKRRFVFGRHRANHSEAPPLAIDTSSPEDSTPRKAFLSLRSVNSMNLTQIDDERKRRIHTSEMKGKIAALEYGKDVLRALHLRTALNCHCSH